jgi:hypothetical protein
MRYQMPFTAYAAIICALSCNCASATNLPLGADALAALQAKADQAEPTHRCVLYAELVSRMTDLAGQQFNSGDSARAMETLTLIRRYAERIQLGIADDSKKLKNAETLLRHSSFRLEGILHEASHDDRPALEVTLKRLNAVQAQLMIQVFKK